MWPQKKWWLSSNCIIMNLENFVTRCSSLALQNHELCLYDFIYLSEADLDSSLLLNLINKRVTAALRIENRNVLHGVGKVSFRNMLITAKIVDFIEPITAFESCELAGCIFSPSHATVPGQLYSSRRLRSGPEPDSAPVPAAVPTCSDRKSVV